MARVWIRTTWPLAVLTLLPWLLGPPTSMRVSNDGRQRTLLYVIEIGGSGYLAGKVVLEEGRVKAVEVPRLR
jgi:hypothetical protein